MECHLDSSVKSTAYVSRARLCGASGNYDQALRDIQASLDLTPRSVEVHHLKGVLSHIHVYRTYRTYHAFRTFHVTNLMYQETSYACWVAKKKTPCWPITLHCNVTPIIRKFNNQ